MSVNLTSILPILVVIVTLYSPVSTVTTCTNYVNGVEDTRECTYSCCFNGGSFSINLNDAEVCSDENQKCFYDKPTIPTSCPIKISQEFEMYGCGVLDACCYPLNEPVPEFKHRIPSKNAVCSTDGKCIGYGPDGFDIWGLNDLKDQKESLTPKDVYCYENCMSVIGSSFDGLEIEELSSLNWPSCSKENVHLCSATTEEVCLFLDISSKADMTVPTSEGLIIQPGDMDIRAFYCGKLDDDIKPENKCNSVKEQFASLSDTLYAVSTIELKNIHTDCGKLDMCVENCVYEEHRPKKKGLAWWGILLIVILIISFVAVISFLLYCIFFRKSAVYPKDEEAGIFFEHLTVIRLREIERYLDDAIASKDMADLKLTVDIVQQEGFQDDLRQKYDTAVRLLWDLMARDAEVKRKELEEEERQAEETKKALQEAEKDILIRLRAKEEVALRRAIKTRDETKDKWAKMWPKLKVLRSMNGINSQLVETVMVEARTVKEEKEKQSRFEEDQAKEAAYCKQLLKESIASDDDGKLERAMQTTDWIIFQNPIMDTDEELRDLRKKARDELEMIRNDTIPLIIPLLRREKEKEKKRGEEERADANKKEEVESAEAQRNEIDGRENEAEEKIQEEEIIAEMNKKEEELKESQRYETIQREEEAEEKRREEEIIAEAIKQKEDELAEAKQHEAIQREKEAEENRQEEERIAEANRKEKEELAETLQQETIQREREAEEKRQAEERIAEAKRKEEEELAEAQRLETIQREREAEEQRQEEEKIAEANRKEEEERIAEAKRKEEEELAEAQRLETIQRERETEEQRQEEEKIAEANRKEEEERITEENREEEERLEDALRHETIQREREAEEKKQEEERLLEAKRSAGLANLVFINAGLQTAIAGNNLEKLEKAIADVEDNDAVDDLADLHKQATIMFKRLKKDKIKKNIQELKRPLIAELKSMSSPPVDVHRSMTAAFILMGENLKDLKTWSNIVILLGKMGKEAVKRKVLELKIEDVTENMVASAEKQIQGLTSDEVYVVNQAASYFYDWADMICVERKQLD